MLGWVSQVHLEAAAMWAVPEASVGWEGLSWKGGAPGSPVQSKPVVTRRHITFQ
jgi:hypothetical protein